MNRFRSILLILTTYALVLSIFFDFRLILFFTEIDRIDFSEDKILTILQAFLMGVRFDIVITGYILFIPALLLFVFEILNKNPKVIYKLSFYWIFILFTLAFIICSADIPYFNHFFSRFSIGAFEWMDSPGFVFNMIIQEPLYFIIVIPLVILIVLFFKILHKIFSRKHEVGNTNVYVKILVSGLFLAIMFLGIRGRIQEKSPIRVGTAYFSNNSFLNQLGLNPVFTLMTSYLETQNERNKSIRLMEDQLAIKSVQNELGIATFDYNSPIARQVVPDSINTNKPNIVIIIMEAMSAAKMTRHGNVNNMTPFLDSLSYQSYYFENIYTAGKHTFNGVFSTLFSFPAIYRQHPLKTISNYNGIGTTLRNHGYSTTYFTTHDSQFDNVEGFLRANDFENIISQANFPVNEVKTTLGVPDDFMFDFSIPIIDKLHNDGRPFLVAYMTASDHGPYYIPDYFRPKNTEIKQQIVEYADWSLQKFIASASKKEWFSNTIFVFIADHGAAIKAPYDISLDYHHSPLIFYAPDILGKPKMFDCIGGQIDVFPSIMGMLKLPYVNNTLGIDLLNEHRPYILINDDDKIGILDNEFLLIWRNNDDSKLFRYPHSDKKNYRKDYPEKALEMEKYAKSNMQVFQYMLLNNKLFVETPFSAGQQIRN